MPFPKKVKLEALVSCQRFCCLCHKRKHTRITCHHIIQEADAGPNTLENCIPLCPDCHAEVKAYDQRHNFGSSPYSIEELTRRRDDWFEAIRRRTTELEKNLTKSVSQYPHAEELNGRIEFNYEDHNGFHCFGKERSEFLLNFSGSSNSSIQVYTDSTNVSIALAPAGSELKNLSSVEELNFSSRVRRPKVGEFLIAENHHSRYGAFQLKSVRSRSHGHDYANVVFDYWILEDGSSNFEVLA